MVVDGQVAMCLDGTPFPVVWEEPEDAERHWRWNGGHYPLPLKSLTVALVTAPGARAAARRPFEEFNLPQPSGIAHQRYLHGFQYLCTDLIGPAYGRANAGAIQAVVTAHNSPFSVWQAHCEPRIKALLADVRANAGSKPLAALAEEAVEAMFLTQVAAAVTGPVTIPLIQVCTEAYGPEGEAYAWELTHGGENLTRDADQALWDLAQVANRNPAMRARLLSEEAGSLDALRGQPEATAFVMAFEAYLERYGERVESWGYDTPTLREEPERLLDLARRTIVEQRPSPASLVRQASERRAALAADLRARLADRPEALARFDAALAEVIPYVTIREDRAYWQLLASGVMRTAIIGRGRRLAEAGVLADAEDVYFLLPDEVETVEATGAMSGDLGAAIETRRREWTHWAAVTPPGTLGPEGEAVAEATSGDEAAVGSGLELRGIAASRGVATGRACVAATLEEAERLEPGQVLVCVMTAPPWTPLFGIAAAIVTDTGLTISHPAIAAREYGIPCVVGVRTATRDIPDGANVIVDGTNGVVRIADASSAMVEEVS